MPTRGDQTTITVSRKIKRRLDELRDSVTYDRFFEDLLRAFSPEMREWLNLLRRPGESYGAALARILPPRGRDPGELKGILERAERSVRTGKVRFERRGGEEIVVVEPWR